MHQLFVLGWDIKIYMFVLGWDEGGDTWNWRHQLFAWEEDMVVWSVGIYLTMLIYRLALVIIDNGNYIRQLVTLSVEHISC